MSDEIRMGNPPPRSSESEPIRRFVPMRVGNASVFVEEVGEPALIEAGDQVRPVAPPSPQEAFENAGEILHECVRVLGERIEALAAKARPQEITVEFSLSFEVKGQASLIPVFVTAASSAQTGLKVIAVWKQQEDKEHKHGSNSAQP
jgi:hypothetical protein